MGKAIPEQVRRQIIDMHKSGKNATEISDELQMNYPGVSKVIRLHRTIGESSFEVNYHRCGRKSVYDTAIREKVNAALAENAALGAPIIRSRLLVSCEDPSSVPHERTIQRWWKAEGKNKKTGRRPSVTRSRYANEVHDTWQVDAKERVSIEDETEHSYLSFTDEASGAYLRGQVFSLYKSDTPSDTNGSKASG